MLEMKKARRKGCQREGMWFGSVDNREWQYVVIEDRRIAGEIILSPAFRKQRSAKTNSSPIFRRAAGLCRVRETV